jgi:preprotein translocase subunit SecF
MRTRILALAAILALATAAVAVAGTNKFSTSVKKQPGSKISFKIKTNKKGVATKVTSLKVSGIQVTCESRQTSGPKFPGPKVSASLGTVKIQKQVLGGTTGYLFQVQKQAGGAFWNVGGALTSKKGRKVTDGSVNAQVNSESQLCEGGGKFGAKRK